MVVAWVIGNVLCVTKDVIPAKAGIHRAAGAMRKSGSRLFAGMTGKTVGANPNAAYFGFFSPI
jgi:hypothetical protein